MRAGWLFAVLLLVGACREPRWDNPEEAYVSFAALARQGQAKLQAGDTKSGLADLKTAYEALSAPTRSAIEARAKELSQASGGAVKDDPVLLTFLSGAKPDPVDTVKVVKTEGDTAVVSVTAGGKTSEQRMVKEGNAWKVDLSEAFKK